MRHFITVALALFYAASAVNAEVPPQAAFEAIGMLSGGGGGGGGTVSSLNSPHQRRLY